MAHRILLRKRDSEKGLEAVPSYNMLPQITLTNDELIIKQFTKSKQSKIRELLVYLSKNPNFVRNQFASEIILVEWPEITINIIDFITWILYSRKKRPNLKQPPRIEQFLDKFSSKALKRFVVKNKQPKNRVKAMIQINISDWL